MPTAALTGSAANAGGAAFVREKIPIAREYYTKYKSCVQLFKDKEIIEKRRRLLCFDLLVFRPEQHSKQRLDTIRSVLENERN
jgi:hypothetical protein